MANDDTNNPTERPAAKNQDKAATPEIIKKAFTILYPAELANKLIEIFRLENFIDLNNRRSKDLQIKQSFQKTIEDFEKEHPGEISRRLLENFSSGNGMKGICALQATFMEESFSSLSAQPNTSCFLTIFCHNWENTCKVYEKYGNDPLRFSGDDHYKVTDIMASVSKISSFEERAKFAIDFIHTVSETTFKQLLRVILEIFSGVEVEANSTIGKLISDLQKIKTDNELYGKCLFFIDGEMNKVIRAIRHRDWEMEIEREKISFGANGGKRSEKTLPELFNLATKMANSVADFLPAYSCIKYFYMMGVKFVVAEE